jgi:hypothetical protein
MTRAVAIPKGLTRLWLLCETHPYALQRKD